MYIDGRALANHRPPVARNKLPSIPFARQASNAELKVKLLLCKRLNFAATRQRELRQDEQEIAWA